MAITIDGDSGVSGVNGSATTPALQGTDSNTGIVFGTDTVQVATGGSTRTTVDSSGRLLVGTTSASGAGRLVVSGNTVNGEDSILTIDRGSATTTSGDTLGRINFTNGGDGAVHAAMLCQTDGTSGSNDNPGRIVFSTTADGAASPTERMRIDARGKVYVNTTDNQGGHMFSLKGDDVTSLVIRRDTSNGGVISFMRQASFVGSVAVTTTSTSYNTSSDYRLKENVVDISDGITRVKQLQPKRFNFIADANTTVDGFLAHEAQAVVPEAVTGTHNEVDNDDNPVYQGIDQSKLVPLLTAALQEAIGKIETLETQNADLLARVTALEAA